MRYHRLDVAQKQIAAIGVGKGIFLSWYKDNSKNIMLLVTIMSTFVFMTVKELLQNPDFNNASLSKNVFGNSRIISDKENNNRGKSWLKGDYEKIADYLKKSYGIICE